MTEKLLEVVGLKNYFFTKSGVVKAIDDLSFSIGSGEALVLVGESGCGKSTICLSILRLVLELGRVMGGQILFDGQDLLTKSDAEMQRYRGSQISMIFQHPTSALNPVLSIGYQIAEPIMEHRKLGSKDAWVEVKEMLSAVRIPRPDIYAHAFPHQISGGMKQRSLAAMALSWQPV